MISYQSCENKAEYPLSPKDNKVLGVNISELIIYNQFMREIMWIVSYPLFYYRKVRSSVNYINKEPKVFTSVNVLLWRCTTISELMINEQIKDKEVRLIGEEGEQLGVMSCKEALSLAKEADLDLVKIAPTAKPPVCKIINYGKYKYELARKDKEARKKQKVVEIKEVRMSPNIDKNDLNTKANMVRKFIAKGDKVKVTLRFRGREMAHIHSSKHILDDFAESLSDIAVVEKPAKIEGRSIVVVLTEKK